MRKLCLALSLNLNTGYDKLSEMTVFELLEMCDDLKDLRKQAERKAKRR